LAEAGLRRGDVILEVDRKKINNVDEFQRIVNQTKAGENLLFLIQRGGSNLFLALKSPGAQG
jgi:serine protease Do